MRKPINFAPRRGAILLCDFGPKPAVPAAQGAVAPLGVKPEIYKERRVVVVSADAFNVRQGGSAGLCTVVPLSGTETVPLPSSHVAIPVGRYRAVTKPVWAKCDLVTTVSHDRLSRPMERARKGQGFAYVSEWVTQADAALIDAALRAALLL